MSIVEICIPQGMIQRLNDNTKDHKAYNDAFDDAAHWLAAMDERVQDCNDTSGDWNTIQDRMDDIKVTMNLYLLLSFVEDKFL